MAAAVVAGVRVVRLGPVTVETAVEMVATTATVEIAAGTMAAGAQAGVLAARWAVPAAGSGSQNS